MKFISFFLLCITTLSYAQNFEGTLIYQNEIEIDQEFSHSYNLTKEQLLETGKFYEETWTTYKDSFYLSRPNRGKIKTIYSPLRNEIITLDKNLDLVPAIKAGVDLETELKFKAPKIYVEETDEIILNIKCSKVVVEWETGTYEYYFNSEYLQMDPSFYSNHKYDMWSEYLNIAKALPLKIVKKLGKMMTTTMTLKEIRPHPVKAKIFKLPQLELSKDFIIKKGNQLYYERQ